MTTTLQDRLGARMQEIASERNGLAGLAEVDKIREHIYDLAEILDDIDADAAAVGAAAAELVEVPFEVTVEHIAALSLIVHEVREGTDELLSYADRINRSITAVDSSRRAQAVSDA